MPPIKTAPERSCAECGRTLMRKRYSGRLEDFGVFQRRMYCDRRCMARTFDARPSAATSRLAKTGNYHARKMVPRGRCSRCGKPNALDVHHLNGDRDDNRMENLTRLCRGCHLSIHRYGPVHTVVLASGETVTSPVWLPPLSPHRTPAPSPLTASDRTAAGSTESRSRSRVSTSDAGERTTTKPKGTNS